MCRVLFPFSLFALNSLPVRSPRRGQDMCPFRPHHCNASRNTDSFHAARAIHTPLLRTSLTKRSFSDNNAVQMHVDALWRRALSTLLVFLFVSTVRCQTLESGNTPPSIVKEPRSLCKHDATHCTTHITLLLFTPPPYAFRIAFSVRRTESTMALRRESVCAF